MKSTKVTFSNADGERLNGIVDTPPGAVRAYALFAHCFTCTKNLKAVAEIAGALASHGIATLRFDFTGLGQSDGEFAATNFSSNVDDLLAAAEFMARDYGAPELLVGHSLGGTAVLQAAASLPAVRAVATIGSPADPEHVTHLFAGDREAIERDGEAEVLLAGRPFRIRRQFLDDLAASELPGSIARLKRAVLIMHSPIDTLVGIDNASELYQAARHPKSFVSLDRADHLLSDPADARYAGQVLAAWAERYLDSPGDDVKDAAEAAAGEVLATTGRDGFRTDIVSGAHRLVADEPADVPGGTDLGPSPYDLLSAALASCTSMTLRMYANHKGIDADTFSVSVRHDRIHAKDCEECETKDGHIDRFVRRIDVRGDFDDEVRERLLQMADRCPVHRTLHSEVLVETDWRD